VRCDVTDEASVENAVNFAVETYGGLHVLYNNAGVMLGDDDNPVTTSVETYQKTMDINVLGTLLGCKYAIPAMQASAEDCGEAAASSTSPPSWRIWVPPPTDCLHRVQGCRAGHDPGDRSHLRPPGVRANALCPGPIMTPLLAKFLSDDAKRNRRLVHIPMGRFGEPVEIANGALFLASNESSWMTGQSLIIDGGITAAYVTPE